MAVGIQVPIAVPLRVLCHRGKLHVTMVWFPRLRGTVPSKEEALNQLVTDIQRQMKWE